MPKQWQNNPIVDETHSFQLDRNAAHYELGMGLPRQEAEAKAYAEYAHQHLVQAASHHLVAQRMAVAAGDMVTAKKHALMLSLYNTALGAAAVGEAHPAVREFSEKAPKKVKYRPHKVDKLLLTTNGTKIPNLRTL